MQIKPIDRILPILFYYTFGIFSIVVLIFCSATGRFLNKFLIYHAYQSIFISAILGLVSYIYSFLFGLIMNLSFDLHFLKSALNSFDVFLNRSPFLFNFSITGFFVTLLVSYLAILAFMGKKSYIPFVSDIINSNLGT